MQIYLENVVCISDPRAFFKAVELEMFRSSTVGWFKWEQRGRWVGVALLCVVSIYPSIPHLLLCIFKTQGAMCSQLLPSSISVCLNLHVYIETVGRKIGYLLAS